MVILQQLGLIQDQQFRFSLNRLIEGSAIRCALPRQMIHHPPNKYDLAFGTTSMLPEGISFWRSDFKLRDERDPVTAHSHQMVNVPQVLLVCCAADRARKANLFPLAVRVHAKT